SKVANRGRRSLINAEFTDDVGELGSAVFQIGRLPGKTTADAGYRIVCRPRGVYQIGPAELVISDPLDLAAVRTTAGGVDRLVVYPAIETLDGFPTTRGHDPSVQSAHPSHAPSGGDDFFTLREYRQGDDLRRVHWPSSAKRDELMIRQLEIPWQSRALVLLDSRASTHTSETFEQAVKGTASVLHHFFGGGYLPQLWIGDSGRPPGPAPYELAMEKLAAVQPMKALDLRHAVLRMRQHGYSGGALVLITGALDDDNLAVFQTLGRDYSKTVLMVVADEAPASLTAFKLGGAATAVVGADDTWAGAWNEAIGAGRWSSASPG
ncbi:MAG: DUF58 domain-containing protein, partial [Acidimicrobiia bacterium]|nr:DUF58 domain-containing protein [Acidimicrobiia bacterium]